MVVVIGYYKYLFLQFYSLQTLTWQNGKYITECVQYNVLNV